MIELTNFSKAFTTWFEMIFGLDPFHWAFQTHLYLHTINLVNNGENGIKVGFVLIHNTMK